MERKLIQLSPSTAVVSLPSRWIRANKLRRGTSLMVEEHENRIIISATRKQGEQEITLDISTLTGRLMWGLIDAAYIAGYDNIILLTRDHEQTSFMTKVVRYFPGMIIFEERRNMVHFNDLAEGTRGDLDKIVDRVFAMNIALLEDCIDAVSTKDLSTLREMKKRDYSINSYISYCLRQLNKFGYTTFSKTSIMHSYLKVLEMLADKICAWATGSPKQGDAIALKGILGVYHQLRHVHSKFKTEHLTVMEEMRLAVQTNSTPLIEVIGLFYDLEELEMQLHV